MDRGSAMIRRRITSSVLLVLLLVVILSMLPLTSASAGLRYPPPGDRTVLAEPGATYSWAYPIFGEKKLSASLNGEIVQYATLDDPEPDGPPRTVRVTLTLPEDPAELPYGKLRFHLKVQEIPEIMGTVAGIAAMQVPMYVLHYAPFPLLRSTFSVEDQEIDEQAKSHFALTSLSEVPIKNVRATITLFDQGEIIGVSEHFVLEELAPHEYKEITLELNTSDLGPGKYDAQANITYDEGEEAIHRDPFNVGTFEITLVKSPDVLYRGKINKVRFQLHNEWNKFVKDVRVSVRIPELGIDEGAFGEMNEIRPFQSKSFTFFLEPPYDAELKEYAGTVSILADAKETNDRFEVPFTVRVLESNETAEAPSQVVEERPGALTFALTPLTGAYLLVLILVIINLFLLFRKRDDKKKGDEGL